MQMITSEAELLNYLQQQEISYLRIEHPPVFTCEEAETYRPKTESVSTKNLFLQDKHGSSFMLMTDCDKRTNLKALGIKIGAAKLQLGSEEKMWELMRVNRGAVTVLGLINDVHHQVQLLIDEDIWKEENFLCHPLVNTSTLVLAKKDLINFLKLSGHDANIVPVPTR